MIRKPMGFSVYDCIKRVNRIEKEMRMIKHLAELYKSNPVSKFYPMIAKGMNDVVEVMKENDNVVFLLRVLWVRRSRSVATLRKKIEREVKENEELERKKKELIEKGKQSELYFLSK